MIQRKQVFLFRQWKQQKLHIQNFCFTLCYCSRFLFDCSSIVAQILDCIKNLGPGAGVNLNMFIYNSGYGRLRHACRSTYVFDCGHFFILKHNSLSVYTICPNESKLLSFFIHKLVFIHDQSKRGFVYYVVVLCWASHFFEKITQPTETGYIDCYTIMVNQRVLYE